MAILLAAVLAVAAIAGPLNVANAAVNDLAFGKVVVDSNKNGAIDAGGAGSNDTALAGVKVTLRGSNASHAGWSTTTAADGSWSFPASADRSASPGPFTVTVDVAGVNGNNYLVPAESVAGTIDFSRVAGKVQQAVSQPIAPDANNVELNELVYPTWSTSIIAANDANDAKGYKGKSIYTGTESGDANSTTDGFDSSQANDRVRTADVVNFNWSLTASAEQDLGSTFDAWFEQTINLSSGSLATFGSLSTACIAGKSTITAYDASGKASNLSPRQDPPVGTVKVVLLCNVGKFGGSTSQKLIDSQIFVSANSINGSTFTTDARSFGFNETAQTTARPDGPRSFGPFAVTSAPRYDIEKQRPWVWRSPTTRSINGVDTIGYDLAYNISITTDRPKGLEAFKQPLTFEDSMWAKSGDTANTLDPSSKWYITSCSADDGGSVGPGNSTVHGKIGGGTQTVGVKSTIENSVRDSGVCSFTREASVNPDTGNYLMTLSGIDNSGASYPTKTIGGQNTPTGKYYIASYNVRAFVPLSAVDNIVAPRGATTRAQFRCGTALAISTQLDFQGPRTTAQELNLATVTPAPVRTQTAIAISCLTIGRLATTSRDRQPSQFPLVLGVNPCKTKLAPGALGLRPFRAQLATVTASAKFSQEPPTPQL